VLALGGLVVLRGRGRAPFGDQLGFARGASGGDDLLEGAEAEDEITAPRPSSAVKVAIAICWPTE
jgi:hypothetical protein